MRPSRQEIMDELARRRSLPLHEQLSTDVAIRQIQQSKQLIAKYVAQHVDDPALTLFERADRATRLAGMVMSVAFGNVTEMRPKPRPTLKTVR